MNMKLADKIINLRKKSGWSQEELAEKMNVSRQSVSKWEGATSIPDLNKIIQLSQIFGVSTDYLLKDEVEEDAAIGVDIEEGYPKISLQAATEYVDQKAKVASIIKKGVLLCIYSIVPLLSLLSLSEREEPILSEAVAVSIGITVMILMVAWAVSIFISTGRYSKDFELIENGYFELEYGVESIFRERSENYRNYFYRRLPILVSAYILSVVPLIITGAFDVEDSYMILMVVVLLLITGPVTYLLIPMASKKESYDKILHEAEHSIQAKEESARVERFGEIYWPIIVAIYLGWSFLTMDWHITWVVWPVAALIFAGLSGFFKQRN
ncbi:MAG: helix-turn-helix transcriptional regulator [Vallitaleaceae bacterium]|nr:helix-turn-helix transcriptional regulator [Vallitaleaceae bacterium]